MLLSALLCISYSVDNAHENCSRLVSLFLLSKIVYVSCRDKKSGHTVFCEDVASCYEHYITYKIIIIWK